MARIAPPTSASADLARLIADLKDPRWRKREFAADSLRGLGPIVYEPLKAEFHRTRQFDFRRRVRQIVREVFLSERLGRPRAFLGISHQRVVLRHLDDARIPPGCTALRITDVFSDLPADQAGVRAGDLLVSLNGKTAAGEEGAMAFTSWIASQGPGTVCRLGVIRGGEGFRLEVGRTTGFKPQEWTRLKLKPVFPRNDSRVPEGQAGLQILNTQGVDPRCGIKEGDLIIALNDQLLPERHTAERLGRWVQESTMDSPAGKGPSRSEPNVEQNSPAPAPSAQILRGGQRLELTATLGRRPAYLKPGPSEFWAADPAKVEAAESAFSAWWESTFDPDGTFVEQAGDDPDWRMEPRHVTR